MSEVAIGWWGLALSLLLIAAAIGVSLSYQLKLERSLLVATLRAIAQLALAGWALALILDDDTSTVFAWLWVGAMVPAAALTAKRRESRLPGLMLSTSIGYIFGLGVSLTVVFALGIMPLENRVLVPIAGMIVGNSLKVVVVAATRLVDAVRDQSGEIEAMLALGIDQRRASVLTLFKDLLRSMPNASIASISPLWSLTASTKRVAATTTTFKELPTIIPAIGTSTRFSSGMIPSAKTTVRDIPRPKI